MNKSISIIIPTYNEQGNVIPLIQRIDQALSKNQIQYEIIFVDDYSTDQTRELVVHMAKIFPITLLVKHGNRGKAQSIIEGSKQAQYDLICMIDGDQQYPPEAIPEMLSEIINGADIVVADRAVNHTSALRKLTSKSFSFLFGKFLHGLDMDIQSGLKLFKKEIIERIPLEPTAWTFDLELLKKAQDAGYVIFSIPIEFQERVYGKTKINVFKNAYEIGSHAVRLKFAAKTVIPFHANQVAISGKGFHYKGEPFVPHNDLPIKQSAVSRITRKQLLVIGALLGLSLAGLVMNWHLAIVIFLGVINVLFFCDLLFNLFIIYRSFSKSPEITIADRTLRRVNDNDWPMYTIFCPLYKEWNVVPQFIKAMNKLDYPKDKLQVMLLLEEDDTQTIDKIGTFNLPEHFDVVVIPDSKPKTKPKALNYGMRFAKGEYVVIYDAEDIPEPDQLKKAILAFSQAGEKTICIQAKLNFYNPKQNLLTRIFTAEYSLWFDLVLTGLQSIHAPIPLGGTSNHFKKGALEAIQKWDAFNVTEDADLGIRLAKAGYRTAIVDSTTYEEANSDYLNWFNQRTRWIKGYIQTYFVHMRDPRELFTNWKNFHFITFNLIIGGKILSLFINPFLWAVTAIYFIFRPTLGPMIESFFPPYILCIAIFSLVFGNFLYYYYYLIGCAKRGYSDLMKYLFLVPIYWLAMSVATWVAVYKFIRQPYYWSKTVHGLHLPQELAEETQTTEDLTFERKKAWAF